MPLVSARRETGAEFQRDRQTKALWILEEVEVALLFFLSCLFHLKIRLNSPSCGLSKHYNAMRFAATMAFIWMAAKRRRAKLGCPSTAVSMHASL